MTKQDEDCTQASQTAEVERIRRTLRQAEGKGKLPLLGAFIKLSGPGWMQSALSLGGGSLAASLYLGILGGMEFLWLQPLAVIAGVIMLSAVSYVVLSTNENPFKLLNDYISPVVAWSWLIGAGLACLVWAFPQFSLAAAVVRENLSPGWLGNEQVFSAGTSQLLICLTLAIAATAMVWAYDAGLRGTRIFDALLKVLIGIMVFAFFGVVIRLAMRPEGLAWAEVFAGLIPDLSLFVAPVDAFQPYLNAVDPQWRQFWVNRIVSDQQDLIITTFAVVVSVNSTVLLSYSMRKKGWDRQFRGLSIFDLSTGFFIPFVLITGCMVVASATLFHTQPVEGLLNDQVSADPGVEQRFERIKQKRVMYELKSEGIEPNDQLIAQRMDQLPEADVRLAAMVVDRDAFNLSNALQPFAGKAFSHYIFGIGVLGLALSTIIIQMVTWGFVVCQMLNAPKHGWIYRFGSLPPALGVLAPFIWQNQAQFWLVVPTSVFVAILLPIAYCAFALLMNSKRVLGAERPRGVNRILWNVLMSVASLLALIGSIWSMWSRVGWFSLVIIATFLGLILLVNALVKRYNFEPSARA